MSSARASALGKLSQQELLAELDKLKASTYWSDYVVKSSKTRASLQLQNTALISKIATIRKQTEAAVALANSVNDGLAQLHAALEMPSGQRFTCAQDEEPIAVPPPSIIATQNDICKVAESMSALVSSIASLEEEMRNVGDKRQRAAQLEKKAAARAEAERVRARFQADMKNMEERRDRASLLHRSGVDGDSGINRDEKQGESSEATLLVEPGASDASESAEQIKISN